MKNNVCTSTTYRTCTGCGACHAICPLGAVKIVENKDGFYRPVVDEIKCTGCSLCTKVCYRCDADYVPMTVEQHESYSAVNKNDVELKSASSGAVSIELMRACLQQGYLVVGVTYDVEKERAVTKIARTEGELEAFKGSKYFQSYTADAFTEMLADKSEQKYAVFGTPCQIYALAKASEVKKDRERFLFVDIFCHGTPSIKLWDKYLDFVKERNKVDAFDDIKFRSKTHGWHEYAMDFSSNRGVSSSSKYNDPFYELFFSTDAMNEACYDCVARSSVEKTDIRIGDFWGKRYIKDIKGVSAVVIASERGRALFASVKDKFDCQDADFEEIISAQSYGIKHKMYDSRRTMLLDMLNSDADIREIVKKHRAMLPLKVNMKRGIKRTLKHLPMSIYVRIKSKLG